MTAPKRKAGGPRGKTLTDQQRRFADLVLAGVPAGRAYERAGYTAKNAAIADSSASRLTRHARVAEYLAAAREKARNGAIASRTERMELLSRIARDGADKDAVAAMKLVAQMEGELVQKHEQKTELSGPGGAPIAVVAAVPSGDLAAELEEALRVARAAAEGGAR